jgi:hypothetical protein
MGDQVVKKSRVVIDSANAFENANEFVVYLQDRLEKVVKVDVVQALVKPELIGGTITFILATTNVPNKIQKIIITPGTYNDSYATFIEHVIELMNAVIISLGDDSIINDGRIRIAETGVNLGTVTVLVSTKTLANALGWPTEAVYTATREYSYDVVRITPIAGTTASFSNIHWPVTKEHAYIHVQQLPSRLQVAGGMQQTYISSNTQTRSVLNLKNGALISVQPKNSIDCFTSTATIEYPVPIAQLNRFDVRVTYADGALYNTTKTLLVMDVYTMN